LYDRKELLTWRPPSFDPAGANQDRPKQTIWIVAVQMKREEHLRIMSGQANEAILGRQSISKALLR
jgi:hypothetical protein